ncbi:10556_t:CDS:1, partial [Paraglomus brasilianum]
MLGRFDNDDDDDTITYTNVCSFVDTDIDNDEEGQSMDYTITTK